MTLPAISRSPLPRYSESHLKRKKNAPLPSGPLRPCHRLAKLAALEEASLIDAEGDTPTIVEDPAQGECLVYRGDALVATFVGVTDEPAVIETVMHQFREELRAFGAALDREATE